MKCLTELFQPSFDMEAFFTPLAARLAKLLEATPTNSWYGCAHRAQPLRQPRAGHQGGSAGGGLPRQVPGLCWHR